MQMRAELDALLAELPADDAPNAVQPARYLSVTKFAKLRDLSARTIRDYCDLGMPHSGEGHNRRILVTEAVAWIESGGPKKARMARGGKAA